MTLDPTLTVLVTGATGHQGGAVVRHLLRQGVQVRALTRDPGKAHDLEAMGAEVVHGDLTDRTSLDAALQGITSVFLMTTAYQGGIETEVRQGLTMADAAKAAGVSHLLFSSVQSANRNTGIPHFDSKWHIENYLHRLEIPTTILRPVFFMDNFASPTNLSMLRTGKLLLPLPPDRPLQMVAVDDIGRFAAEAFLHPEEFLDEAIDLAGDELTGPRAAQFISAAAGQPISYQFLPLDQAQPLIGTGLTTMFRWLNDVGYNVNITALERHRGLPMTDFGRYLSSASWLGQLHPAEAIAH